MTEPAQLNDNNENILRLKIVQQGQLFLSAVVMAQVLTALNGALESFLLAELLGNHSHPKPALKKEIGRLASGMQLLLTGVNLEHFILPLNWPLLSENLLFVCLKTLQI